MIEQEQEFNQEYLPPVKKPSIININKRGLLKVFVFSLIIILLILFLINNFSSQQNQSVVTQPTPEPEIYFPRPTSSINLPASALASDAAVLKTKTEVEENINTANTLDLSESNLSFPILDFNIGFQ